MSPFDRVREALEAANDYGLYAPDPDDFRSKMRQAFAALEDMESVGSPYKWIADIRFALGDNGKRMLPELVEHCKSLAEIERERAFQAENLQHISKINAELRAELSANNECLAKVGADCIKAERERDELRAKLAACELKSAAITVGAKWPKGI